MRILGIISGEYGQRHIDNIIARGPDEWQTAVWVAPSVLPPVVDYPEDYLPESMPPTDLILSFAEHKGVAELLPDIASMTGAVAVIAAIDNEAWLPRGLARQLRGWLSDMNVACATPKPLCSLTERDYGVTLRERMSYENAEIAEFARFFGKPELDVIVDPDTRIIKSVSVIRDAVCGCTNYVAKNIIGLSADEVEDKAGLLHHHYPCLASMKKEADFNMDTLMHASGSILKENISKQVKPFKEVRYLSPGKRSET